MTNPYPGLRPFTEADHEFFRGRDEEIEILLHRLAERRLIGVLGVSGCGKSSLVQAGLFPLLWSGLADPLGGDWTILRMVPGDGPWAALEQAAGVTLPRRSHALRDWAHAHGGQILLLVDQFEEIFDFRRRSLEIDGGNEAALFVDAILAAAPAMHILFTMRTDFLGECALFRGLAEALNDGHYLVPRTSNSPPSPCNGRPNPNWSSASSPMPNTTPASAPSSNTSSSAGGNAATSISYIPGYRRLAGGAQPRCRGRFVPVFRRTRRHPASVSMDHRTRTRQPNHPPPPYPRAH